MGDTEDWKLRAPVEGCWPLLEKDSPFRSARLSLPCRWEVCQVYRSLPRADPASAGKPEILLQSRLHRLDHYKARHIVP
jgi:hypothetical protein